MKTLRGQRSKEKVLVVNGVDTEHRKWVWIMFATVFFASSVVLAYNMLRNERELTMEQRGSALLQFFRPIYMNPMSMSPVSKGNAPVVPTMPLTGGGSPARNWNNVLVGESSNYTTTLMDYVRMDASINSPCHGLVTNSVKLEGLPKSADEYVSLETDVRYEVTLVAYDGVGERRCSGGDYFELDFHDREHLRYRSRLPTVDFGNGSYGVEIVVPTSFAGGFTLEIWLLYTNWVGLGFGEHWSTDQKNKTVPLMLRQELELISAGNSSSSNESGPGHGLAPGKNLSLCTWEDYDRTTWQGRWTRGWFNESCQAREDGRFLCLPEEHYQCEEPWCYGPLGRLESSGWRYTAHCSFKIFEAEEAWNCLDGKWVFIWGDSSAEDSIRNLALLIMNWETSPSSWKVFDVLRKNYDIVFVNPQRVDQTFRISLVWNLRVVADGSAEGFLMLKNEQHQERLRAYFNGTNSPDVVYFNSGLHDGWQFHTLEDYVEAAGFAVRWWVDMYESIPVERRPVVIWRSTVAPAGFARKMQSNVNKMDMYNLIVVEMLQQVRDRMPVKFIDGFDLSFPFHYDNMVSDGGHYGRMPGLPVYPWPEGVAHYYFVDLMFMHIMLNIACPAGP